VFLLDPWWNPAVEAQAIDRAHRIGRTRRVIATRLVARDTIEEKILQLQASKRALADAILTADKGVMASIGREELELLLGQVEGPPFTVFRPLRTLRVPLGSRFRFTVTVDGSRLTVCSVCGSVFNPGAYRLRGGASMLHVAGRLS